MSTRVVRVEQKGFYWYQLQHSILGIWFTSELGPHYTSLEDARAAKALCDRYSEPKSYTVINDGDTQ